MESVEDQVTEGVDLLTNQDMWINLGQSALRILIILVISTVLIKLGKLAINNIFKVRTHAALRISERREATLVKLVENAITYVVYFNQIKNSRVIAEPP